MNYYTVLSAASALLMKQRLTMRRCRRRFNGPHRYVLNDAQGNYFHFDEASKNRRMGYTLLELLEWLAKRPDPQVAAAARDLMRDLDAWFHLKSANS